MKNYTTVMNSITSKLSSSDTYRFVCLSFTPRKDGYTDSTFKQIGEYINKNNPESERTVEKFVHRLKAIGIIKIEEVIINGKRRNKYYFINPEYKFLIINKELLELELPIELKGFMIQLFSLTINNTFECNYSLNKIVSLIKVSKPTAQKYLKELTEKGHIIKTESGYKLSSKYFSIGNKKESEIQSIYEKIKDCEYLLQEFIKTDWKTIKRPVEYWNSIEGGYRGKKLDKVVNNELVIL